MMNKYAKRNNVRILFKYTLNSTIVSYRIVSYKIYTGNW